jgi:hypothetical protein
MWATGRDASVVRRANLPAGFTLRSSVHHTVGGGPVAAEGETMLTSLMVSCSVAQAMHL